MFEKLVMLVGFVNTTGQPGNAHLLSDSAYNLLMVKSE